jgi:hypothetical protein
MPTRQPMLNVADAGANVPRSPPPPARQPASLLRVHAPIPRLPLRLLLRLRNHLQQQSPRLLQSGQEKPLNAGVRWSYCVKVMRTTKYFCRPSLQPARCHSRRSCRPPQHQKRAIPLQRSRHHLSIRPCSLSCRRRHCWSCRLYPQPVRLRHRLHHLRLHRLRARQRARHLRLLGRRPMCFLQTRIESYAANAVIDTITSAGIVTALCATETLN